MAQDRNGNNHKAAGRPDGGQFDRKAGQGSDDDLVPAAEETLAEGCARRVREYGGGSADEDDALIAREGMNTWTPTSYEAFSTLIGDTVDGMDEGEIGLETMGSWMRSMHRVELRALEGVDGEYARDLRDGIRKYMAAADIDEDGPQEDGDEELIREAGLDVYEPDPLDLADAIVNGGMDTLEAAGFDEDSRFAWARAMYRRMGR